LLTSAVGVVVSNEVWVKTLGHKDPLTLFGFGMLDNPALYSMAAAFIGIWLFSILDRSASANKEREAYDAQFVRSETGIGASAAHVH
jgi:cation/acetate symporter